MNAADLYTYLHFHTWKDHPSDLGPFGVAVMLEQRPDHPRGISHTLGPNGIPAGCEHGDLNAAMVLAAYAMHRGKAA